MSSSGVSRGMIVAMELRWGSNLSSVASDIRMRGRSGGMGGAGVGTRVIDTPVDIESVVLWFCLDLDLVLLISPEVLGTTGSVDRRCTEGSEAGINSA